MTNDTTVGTMERALSEWLTRNLEGRELRLECDRSLFAIGREQDAIRDALVRALRQTVGCSGTGCDGDGNKCAKHRLLDNDALLLAREEAR